MKNKIISTFVSIAALSAITNMAWAAGTIAGTDIDNTASISYKVGTVDQTAIYSTPGGNSLPGVPGSSGAPTIEAVKTTFVVDRKVDLTVTPLTDITVVPNASAVTTFSLKNTGNDIEFFHLDQYLAEATGDNFDMSSCSATVASVNDPGPTPDGVSVANPLKLAADGTANINVTCTAPPSSATVFNGQTSIVHLVATAVTASAGSTALSGSADIADTAATEQIVLADANGTAPDGTGALDDQDRDAKHSATRTYTIATPELKVTKTSVVVCDPHNDTTDPKRIPGAVIQYTIIIDNPSTAAVAANDVIITDPIPTNMAYISAAPAGCTYTVAASTTSNNGASNAVTLTGPEPTGSTPVTSQNITMPVDSSAKLVFYAEVQ